MRLNAEGHLELFDYKDFDKPLAVPERLSGKQYPLELNFLSTPDPILRLAPEQKIKIAEQLFDRAEEVRMVFAELLRTVLKQKSGLEALRDWLAARLEWFRRMESAIETDLSPGDQKLFQHYRSSYWQTLDGLSAGLSNIAEGEG